MLSGLSCGWSQDPCLRFYDNAPEGGRVAEILTQGQSIGISPRSIESYPDSVNLVSTPSSSDQQYKDGDLLDSTRDPCLRFYDNAPEGGRVAEILTQGQSIGISPRSIESYPDSVNLVSTPSSSDQQYKDGDLLDSTRDQLGMMYISTMAQNTPSNKATNLQVAPSKLSLISLPNDLGSDEELTPGIVTSGKIGNNNNHHQQIGLQDENILVQSDFVRMINNNANNNNSNNNNNSVVSNQTLNRSMVG
eukprot:TRINITY_DN11665_c0_g1_i1.p1 TRINITY_DN11665_c0_g1~~TRINITY_DN11665_c0_g1_i1.p1  ORF type:complete len:248 (+),score=32.33 TRINITY_DN11665_c0_g1_i1:321-1064(+)